MTGRTKMVTVGEPCPHFGCRTATHERFFVDTMAGRTLVIAFLPSAAHPLGARFLAAMAPLAGRFDDNSASFFGITIDPADEARLQNRIPGIRYMFDDDRTVSTAFGLFRAQGEDALPSFSPALYVVSPRYQVIARLPLAEPELAVTQLAGILDRLPAPAVEGPAVAQAPVLTVPGVFEPELCRRLIEEFHRTGGRQSGFMTEQQGMTVGVLNSERKRRYDCSIEDEELKSVIRDRMSSRLLPEITKAFQFRASRIERYLVACYDSADAGYFRAHRDNTTKGTAHRQFAVTINLNSEFSGGNLIFPEFGKALFRTPPGAGIVFSCSLLHEARPVTDGKRFAFLTFLYDNAMARLRAENSRFLVTDTPTTGEPAPQAVEEETRTVIA